MLHHLIRELDFDAILEIIAAHAQTEMGRFFLSDSSKILDRDTMARRTALFREFSRFLEDHDRLSFRGIDEVRPLLESGDSIPAEMPTLMLLMTLARRIAAVRRALLNAPEELEELRELAGRLPDTAELIRWAAPKLGADGRVPDEASPELAALRRKISRTRGRILHTLEGIKRTHSAALADAPPTMRRERYCLPVKASSRSKLPGLLLDHSSSGATSFIEPFETVELNNELTSAFMAEEEEIRKILASVAAAFSDLRSELREALQILAILDAAQAALLFGERIDGRLIEARDDADLLLIGARHPLLDERLAELRAVIRSSRENSPAAPDRRKAVPLDFRMPHGTRTLVISGPNAGGKTVVLKTIGVMVLMAYAGIPIPVEEGSSIPVFSHIWCHIGDEQDVSADLSTFSGAMQAGAQMLEEAGTGSLILYDELGSGTDPLEGAALGCALLERLSEKGALSIVTTHLAAIAMTASSAPEMANAAMEYDEVRNRPTYRLRMGRPGRSRGLEIAEAVGIEKQVIDRARRLLGGEHLKLDTALKRLEELEARSLEERDATLSERIKLEAERLELRNARRELEEQRKQLPDEIRREKEKLRRDARKRLDRALETLDEATREQRHLGRKSRQKLREEALGIGDFLRSASGSPGAAELRENTEVRILSLGKEGILRQLRGKQAQVLVGNTRLWVPRSDLETLSHADRPNPPQRKAEIKVEPAGDTEAELMLLGQDSTEARENLERFLDHAMVSGLRVVRIVHGHGTGTLRRMVGEVLRNHPGIASFGHPPRSRGGTGATEAIIRD